MVYLTFTFNWVPCILAGNPMPCPSSTWVQDLTLGKSLDLSLPIGQWMELTVPSLQGGWLWEQSSRLDRYGHDLALLTSDQMPLWLPTGLDQFGASWALGHRVQVYAEELTPGGKGPHHLKPSRGGGETSFPIPRAPSATQKPWYFTTLACLPLLNWAPRMAGLWETKFAVWLWTCPLPCLSSMLNFSPQQHNFLLKLPQTLTPNTPKISHCLVWQPQGPKELENRGYRVIWQVLRGPGGGSVAKCEWGAEQT